MSGPNGSVPTLLRLVREREQPVAIFALTRDNPEHWTLIPEVIAHIREFCRRYDTDTKAEELTQAVLEHFVVAPERQTVRVVAAVTPGPVLQGHLIVSLDTWCGKIIATIVQYEMHVAAPRGLIRDTLDQIAWWARGKGASTLRVLAIHDDERGFARARLFRSLYGFEPRRVMLDKTL